MIKKLLVSAIILSSFAYAEPDIWEVEHQDNYTMYSLYNASGDSLWIRCNLESERYDDHTVVGYKNGDDPMEDSDRRDQLGIVTANQLQHWYIPRETYSQIGSNQWDKFLKVILTDPSFSIRKNDSTIGVFAPKNTNLVANDLIKCPSMLNKMKSGDNIFGKNGQMADGTIELEYKDSGSDYQILITALTDFILIENVSINRNNCAVTQFYKAPPYELKFGDALRATVPKSCNMREIGVATDKGDARFRI